MVAIESLQVYRRLLRSAAQAFKGDIVMLSAARQEIRSKLESSRSVTNPEELQELRTQGLEAAAFLKSAILQAEANESGNFGTSQLKKIASIRSTSKQYSTPVLPPYDAEMNVSADQVNTYMEPIVTGMSLPREKKSRGKKE